MKGFPDWADGEVRHFISADAVGWMAPDGRIFPTNILGHLDAFRRDARLRGLLPAEVDWSAEDSEVMDVVYGHGWGRIGTWGEEPAGWMGLECFIEHLKPLRKHAEALAEIVGRRLEVYPVFTREDALPRPETLRKRGSQSPALKSISRGSAVGWLSPDGRLVTCHPNDQLAFLRGGDRTGVEGLAKWLKEADALYERWQSDQFAEGLDPDEHPEWHRFYADLYVAPPEVVASVREKAVSRGWGFVETDGKGGLSLVADPRCDEALRGALEALRAAEEECSAPSP